MSYSSLIVCDGDMDLGYGHIINSILIANGDIRPVAGTKISGGDRSAPCAAGDIRLPDRKGAGGSYFLAGGTVTFAEKHKPSPQVKERQKSLPFGVRFLDPKEFGLELAAQNGGVQVLALHPASPFAKFGV